MAWLVSFPGKTVLKKRLKILLVGRLEHFLEMYLHEFQEINIFSDILGDIPN
jgi:hypothetical protein